MRSSTMLLLTALTAASLLSLEMSLVAGAPVSAADATSAAKSTQTKENGENGTQAKEVLSSKEQLNDVATNSATQEENKQQPNAVVAPKTAELVKPVGKASVAKRRRPSFEKSVLEETQTRQLVEPVNYDDVTEPLSYSDIDLLLSDPRLFSQAFGRGPNDVMDDEASLQQLFSAGSRANTNSADDIDVSPQAMAEYLLETGDFASLRQATEELVAAGILRESEAESYRDAVGLEYLAMLEEGQSALRDERDSYPMRLQEESEEIGVPLPYDVAGDYIDYDAGKPVLLPPELLDYGAAAYQPEAGPTELTEDDVNFDPRFLEELLAAQRPDVEDSSLQDELDEAAEAHRGNNKESLEEELESLPLGNKHEEKDKDEEELETVRRQSKRGVRQDEKISYERP